MLTFLYPIIFYIWVFCIISCCRNASHMQRNGVIDVFTIVCILLPANMSFRYLLLVSAPGYLKFCSKTPSKTLERM